MIAKYSKGCPFRQGVSIWTIADFLPEFLRQKLFFNKRINKDRKAYNYYKLGVLSRAKEKT